MPSSPPPAQTRLEGLKAVANCSSAMKNESRIVLVADVAETASGPVIRFTLVNTSSQPLNVYPFQLPWGNPNSVQIAATTLHGEMLPVVWPIADPGPEEPLVLEPGKTLTGDLLLGDRVDAGDLLRARRTGDVMVAWCYAFTPLGEKEGHKATGIVMVPRGAF
jgi:hypothetical protein